MDLQETDIPVHLSLRADSRSDGPLQSYSVVDLVRGDSVLEREF